MGSRHHHLGLRPGRQHEGTSLHIVKAPFGFTATFASHVFHRILEVLQDLTSPPLSAPLPGLSTCPCRHTLSSSLDRSQVQVGHTGCLVGAFLAASVRVCKSCGSYSFCDMAHQRCDVEQHLKSYGSRRAAKRDSDGWLVVSVGLFSECGTSTCLLGKALTFLPSLYGGDNFTNVFFFDSVCHQRASFSFVRQYCFKWKVLVGVCVAVRLVHLVLGRVTKHLSQEEYLACARGASPSCKLSFVLPRWWR